MRQVKSPTKA